MQEEAFQLTLDQNYLDSATRLVYADWLTDQDRLAEAALQRYLTASDTCSYLFPLPERERVTSRGVRNRAGTYKWAVSPRSSEISSNIWVNRLGGYVLALHQALAPGAANSHFHYFRDRRAAETAIAAAWRFHPNSWQGKDVSEFFRQLPTLARRTCRTMYGWRTGALLMVRPEPTVGPHWYCRPGGPVMEMK